MPFLRRYRRMVPRLATCRLGLNSTCLDWLLPLPAFQQRRQATRPSRRPPPLARLLCPHSRVPPSRSLWRAGCKRDWKRLARWSIVRPGRSRLRLRGDGIGRTQRRRTAYPPTVILGGQRHRRTTQTMPTVMWGRRSAIYRRLHNWLAGSPHRRTRMQRDCLGRKCRLCWAINAN